MLEEAFENKKRFSQNFVSQKTKIVQIQETCRLKLKNDVDFRFKRLLKQEQAILL